MSGNLQVIGICGPLGSGKSTVAKALEAQGYVRLAMAKPLKDMMRALGLNEMDVSGPQSHREQPSDLLCGKSPRYAMQTIGTEWGRDLIGADLWANAVQAQIISLQTQGVIDPRKAPKGVVIEDIRFPNEWAMVSRLGGVMWRIRRPDVERKPTVLDRWIAHGGFRGAVARGLCAFLRLQPLHPSEVYWRDCPADAEFWNTGQEADLIEQAQGLATRLRSKETANG